MNYENMMQAEVRDGDGRAMVEAINTLMKAGVDVRRPENNQYQIKVSPSISYYPTTQKIVVDATPALKIRGTSALIAYLFDNGLKSGMRSAVRN